MGKILSLCVLFVNLFFIACSENTNSNLSLKVGISPNYKPFDYKEDAKLTGFDVDLVEAIAQNENIDITWVEISFDGLIPALKSSKIDMIASAMSQTDERKQSVDFTNTYYVTKNLYIKHKNNNSLNSKKDLEGKKIGVQLGTVQEPIAKAIKNAKVQTNEDLNIAVLALKNEKIDALIADKDVVKGYLKENPELEAFFEEDDGSSGFSFAFDKNKQKPAIEKFNKGLEDLKKQGVYTQLLEKYGL